MTAKETTISVPNGYTVKEDCCEMPIDQAVALLCSERQNEYTCAVRKEGGTRARLMRSRYVCPYCGEEFSGAQDFAEREDKPVSAGRVLEWAHPLNERIFTPKIDLAAFDRQAEAVSCANCGEICTPCFGMNEFRLEQGENEFSLAHETIDVQELLDLTKDTKNEICFVFPLYEKITFYRERRQVILKLCGESGTPLWTRDITRLPAMWRRASVCRIGFRYKRVLQTIRQWLERGWETALPFRNEELTPERLALLVRYPGFDRSFYEAIPFRCGTWGMDPSFRDAERLLRSPKQAREALAASSLPQVHSVRKLFFERQGLFFYLKECEALWQVLKDPNLLRRTLCIGHTFGILSGLHTYPGTMRFLSDLCHARGGVFLVRQMQLNWKVLFEQAFQYSVGNEQVRKALLTGKCWKDQPFRPRQEYSFPICIDTNGIEDIRVDGFEFRIVRTWGECRSVGRELHNCLSGISPGEIEDTTLVWVRADEKTVGAIEVEDGEISQAYAAYNEPLGTVPGLQEASERWARHFGLIGMKRP